MMSKPFAYRATRLPTRIESITLRGPPGSGYNWMEAFVSRSGRESHAFRNVATTGIAHYAVQDGRIQIRIPF